jgi:hypothetical protein
MNQQDKKAVGEPQYDDVTMVDVTIHDLMNLGTSDSVAARLVRTVCKAWEAGCPERSGPEGPRIGTFFVESSEGLLQLRLVTRLGYPKSDDHGVVEIVEERMEHDPVVP